MGQPQFVQLHVHTDYSLLDGACETSELLDEASRQKMPAVAITDHGNLFAAANFFYEASKRGVKPIIGCEVYVAKGSRLDRGEKVGPVAQNGVEGEPGMRGSNHLLLLCESNEGYQNLIKLVSAGFLEGFYYKPRIDHELLSKHSRGLIALSACLRGAVTEAVAQDRYREALENAYRLQDLFGKGTFVHACDCRALQRQNRKNSRPLPRIQSSARRHARWLFREGRAGRICRALAPPRAFVAAGGAAKSPE